MMHELQIMIVTIIERIIASSGDMEKNDITRLQVPSPRINANKNVLNPNATVIFRLRFFVFSFGVFRRSTIA